MFPHIEWFDVLVVVHHIDQVIDFRLIDPADVYFLRFCCVVVIFTIYCLQFLLFEFVFLYWIPLFTIRNHLPNILIQKCIPVSIFFSENVQGYYEKILIENIMSQGLLGLCCSIETRDHIEIITITAVLFE